MDLIKILNIATTVLFVINGILDYRAKRFDSIPGVLLLVYLLSIGLIFEYVPERIEVPFIYTASVVAILACLLTAQFHRKRNNRFDYWFSLVLAILLFVVIVLGSFGIISVK